MEQSLRCDKNNVFFLSENFMEALFVISLFLAPVVVILFVLSISLFFFLLNSSRILALREEILARLEVLGCWKKEDHEIWSVRGYWLVFFLRAHVRE